MKASMKIFYLVLVVLTTSNFCQGQVSPVSIPEGTKISVQLEQDLSGDTSQEGQVVQLSVVREVRIGDVVVIAQGANVTGKVTLAQPKRRMGRTGKIDFSIERVTAVDKSDISLRYTVNKIEGGSRAVSTGALTAGVAIGFFPAAPFVLLRMGNEAIVGKGTIFEVFTDQTHILSVMDDAKNSRIDIMSDPAGADVEINGDFVGSAPLSLDLPTGDYEIVLKKKGFRDWNRRIKSLSSSVGVNAELEPEYVAASTASSAVETTTAGSHGTPALSSSYKSAATADKPVETNKPELLQGDSAALRFENEIYVVQIGAIGKNEAGKTSIELLGDKIGGQIPIRNGKATPPVGMKIIANGQTFEFQSADISNIRHIFNFDATAAPEKIIVYGNDGSNGSSATFDVKTRRFEDASPL